MKAFMLHRSYATAAKKYTEDHEAVVFDDSTGVCVVSITDYAQKSLGDVVFVELPALKTEVTKGGQKFPRSPGVLRHLMFVISPLESPPVVSSR